MLLVKDFSPFSHKLVSLWNISFIKINLNFQQDDHKVVFKNNNLWLFVDSQESNETDISVGKSNKSNYLLINILFEIQRDNQQWLSTLDMLPVSDAVYATPNSNETIDWTLFDVYKIAPHFPLEISIFAYVFNSIEVEAKEGKNPLEWARARISVTAKFQSKSTRNDLKGLKLKCGLVVSISVFINNFMVHGIAK